MTLPQHLTDMLSGVGLFDLIPPNMVTHFKPEGAFLDWFVGHVGDRFVIEVGAGQCEFAKALFELGVKVLAVEPRPNEEVQAKCVSFLLPMAVEQVSLVKKPDSVIVAARPDHSGWFTEMCEDVHEDSELIYIGLPKNVGNDIPHWADVEELYSGAGEDGEIVLRITRGA